MINLLSYLGLSLQSEVCLWTILGLVRTIFDATLFKVNANLKQVWQMSMPEELSLSVQRVIRTMVSGVMLVQCFTVYVYLASYIVLLYPVFLEDRPTLVLPWLLLAAIRQLLCELTNLALGLGICLLLGAARPPCIKFVIIKVASIMPSFYMWMLVYSYHHALKVATLFKTFPAVLPRNEHDYGLELAVRRRRTKSLLGEEELRKGLIATFYHNQSVIGKSDRKPKPEFSSRMTHGTDTDSEDLKEEFNAIPPLITPSSRLMSDTPMCYEDWFGSEVMVPRDTDRILEQFGVMMLRIGVYLKMEKTVDFEEFHVRDSESICKFPDESLLGSRDCAALPPDDLDTPRFVGFSNARTASYVLDYPQIFLKKSSDMPLHSKTLSFESNVEPKRLQSTDTVFSKQLNLETCIVNDTNSQISIEQEKTKKDEISDKSVSFISNNAKEASIQQCDCAKYDDFKSKISDSLCNLESLLNEINTSTSTRHLSLENDKNNEIKGSQSLEVIEKFHNVKTKIILTLPVVKSSEDHSSLDSVSCHKYDDKKSKKNQD